MSDDAIEAIHRIAEINTTVGKLSDSVTDLRQFVEDLKAQASTYARQLRCEEIKVITSMARYRSIILQMQLMLAESTQVLERNINSSDKIITRYYRDRNEDNVNEERAVSSEEIIEFEHSVQLHLQCPHHEDQQPSTSKDQIVTEKDYGEKILSEISEGLLPFKKRFAVIEKRLCKQINERESLLTSASIGNRTIGTQTESFACSKVKVNRSTSTQRFSSRSSSTTDLSKTCKDEKYSKNKTTKPDSNENEKHIRKESLKNKEIQREHNNSKEKKLNPLNASNFKENDKHCQEQAPKQKYNQESVSSKATHIVAGDKQGAKDLSSQNIKIYQKECTKSKHIRSTSSKASKSKVGEKYDQQPTNQDKNNHNKSKINQKESTKSKINKQSTSSKTSKSKVDEKQNQNLSPRGNNENVQKDSQKEHTRLKDNKQSKSKAGEKHNQRLVTQDKNNHNERTDVQKVSIQSKDEKLSTHLNVSIDIKEKKKNNLEECLNHINGQKAMTSQREPDKSKDNKKSTDLGAAKPSKNVQKPNRKEPPTITDFQSEVNAQRDTQKEFSKPNDNILSTYANESKFFKKHEKHGQRESPKPMKSQKELNSIKNTQKEPIKSEDTNESTHFNILHSEIHVPNDHIKQEDYIVSSLNSSSNSDDLDSDTTLVLEENNANVAAAFPNLETTDVKPDILIVKCESTIQTSWDSNTLETNSGITQLLQTYDDPKLIAKVPVVVLDNSNFTEIKQESVDAVADTTSLKSNENSNNDDNVTGQNPVRLSFQDFKLKYKDKKQNAPTCSTTDPNVVAESGSQSKSADNKSKDIKNKSKGIENKSKGIGNKSKDLENKSYNARMKRKTISGRNMECKKFKIDNSNFITYIPIINLDAIAMQLKQLNRNTHQAISYMDDMDQASYLPPRDLLKPITSTCNINLDDITRASAETPGNITPNQMTPVNSIYKFNLQDQNVNKKSTSFTPFKYHAVNEKLIYLPPDVRDNKKFVFNEEVTSINARKCKEISDVQRNNYQDNTCNDDNIQPLTFDKKMEHVSVPKVSDSTPMSDSFPSTIVGAVQQPFHVGNNPPVEYTNRKDIFSRDPRRYTKGFYIENEVRGRDDYRKPYEAIYTPSNLDHFKKHGGNI